MADILDREESYAIMGACFNVFKEKGTGFVEPVYQECMEIEFQFQGIPFDAQRRLHLEYRGRTLNSPCCGKSPTAEVPFVVRA